MNPLSAQQKKFLYEQCAFGKLRWIAKPAYDLILGAELLWHRLEDWVKPVDKADVSDLTAIIKTFERPYAVKRLVRSIQRRYPALQILVVDDSREPVEIRLPGVEVITLPYDSGISIGRNHALDIIKTPYFLLLDDDFVFSHRQKLGAHLSYMNENPRVDILGGRYIDLPFYITHEFQHASLGHTTEQAKMPIGTIVGDFPVVSKVQNYFVGRTESIRQVKWKPELKVNEHTEFFTRAFGKLVTVFDPAMLILHAKTPFDIAYLQKRFRIGGP